MDIQRKYLDKLLITFSEEPKDTQYLNTIIFSTFKSTYDLLTNFLRKRKENKNKELYNNDLQK